MKIHKKIIEMLIGQSVPDNIQFIIRNSGFFCYQEKDMIDFEPSSNRSDCNSILGVCNEIAAILFNGQAAYKNVDCSGIDQKNIDIEQVKGYCILKINKLFLDEAELFTLKSNRLFSECQSVSIANYLSMVSGNPFIPIPESSYQNIRLECDEDGRLCVLVNDDRIYWGESVCLETNTYISLNIDASYQKKIMDKFQYDTPLRNYYIRNGYNLFYSEMLKSLSERIDSYYLCCREDSFKIINVNLEQVIRLLGITLSEEQIRSTLTSLDYTYVEKTTWKTPTYRSDVIGLRDVAMDIWRIGLRVADKPDVRTISASDSTLKEYMKYRILRERLLSSGLNEVCSFPFVESSSQNTVSILSRAIAPANALCSDSKEKMEHALRNSQHKVGCFEFSTVFICEEKVEERKVVSFGVYNEFASVFWNLLISFIKISDTVRVLQENKFSWTIMENHTRIGSFRYILSNRRCWVAEMIIPHIKNTDSKIWSDKPAHFKTGSIDLPVAYSVVDFIRTATQVMKDVGLSGTIEIVSWDYLEIGQKEIFNCRYCISFGYFSKDLFHKFNIRLRKCIS